MFFLRFKKSNDCNIILKSFCLFFFFLKKKHVKLKIKYLALLDLASLGCVVDPSILLVEFGIGVFCSRDWDLAAIFLSNVEALEPTLSVLSASVILSPHILRLKRKNFI